MSSQTFLVIAAFVLAYGLVSRRIESSVVSAPMVFVAFGMVACPTVLGLINLTLEDEFVFVLAELTLVLVLFTDAARIDLTALRREAGLPIRMLAIGLPLAGIFGGLTALLLFPELSIWEAFLLGAILAPTDAALGRPVITDRKVPVRIRQALNVESGLNDGLALPAVLFFASCAAGLGGEAEASAPDDRNWMLFLVLQLVLGPLAGIGVGLAGGWLIRRGVRSQMMSPPYQKLAGPSLALLAYAVAVALQGNGFIAAFVAGLMVGNLFGDAFHRFDDFAEAEVDLLVLLSFMLFGSLMVWPAVEHLSMATVAYAIFSLTLVRVVSIALSLIGSGLRLPSVVFLAWFGPRGLASIVFGLLVLEQLRVPHSELIFQAVAPAVLLSVVAHGLTARPASRWYGRYTGRQRTLVEHEPVVEHPPRR